MKKEKSLFSINNNWFFSDLPGWCKCSLIFIRGDAIILVPLLIGLMIIAFFSLRFSLLMTGLFISVRFFGEMIYWLLQQFGARTYRPYDWGFRNLDNHAVYILYQTAATLWLTCGLGLVMYTLLYLY